MIYDEDINAAIAESDAAALPAPVAAAAPPTDTGLIDGADAPDMTEPVTADVDYDPAIGVDPSGPVNVPTVAAPTNAEDYADFPQDTGLIDTAVSDINTLTNQNNPLMAAAETRGLQAANSRGLLNSSMAVGAVEAERLNAVMPLVQKNMEVGGQGVLQDDAQVFTGSEKELDRILTGDLQDDKQAFDAWYAQYTGNLDKELLELDFGGREDLVALDYAWKNYISSSQDASDFWETSVDGIMDILNNPDMTQESQDFALSQLLGSEGYTAADGTVHAPTQGTIFTGLDMIASIYGGEAADGTTYDPTTGAPPPVAAATPPPAATPVAPTTPYVPPTAAPAPAPYIPPEQGFDADGNYVGG